MAIAEKVPHHLLFGDYIFSENVPRRKYGDSTRFYSDMEYVDRVLRHIDEDVATLRQEAKRFIEKTIASLRIEQFDVFGFNLMFQTAPSLALARQIKILNPNKMIIIGGASCEGTMGLALHKAFPWIDFVCRGEGEILVTSLYSEIAESRPRYTDVSGLVWRGPNGETISSGERAATVDDLDSLPKPDYDDWLKQVTGSDLFGHLNNPSLPIESSRGCWYGQKNHCIFCGLNGEVLKFRAKSPNRFIEECLQLSKYAITNIYAVDLIFPNKYFDTVLPRLKESRLPFSFYYETKSNLGKEQLKRLVDAGITSLQPGIESLNSNMLKTMRKGVAAYQNIRLLKWAAELGIATDWNILIGVPYGRASEYHEMASIIPKIEHLRAPTMGCIRMRADRFSPMHDDATAFGLSKLAPETAYQQIYDLPASELKNIAYYFRYEIEQEEEVSSAISSLGEAVKQWRSSNADQTFVDLTLSGGRAILFDRRNIALEAEVYLSEEETRIYRQCDKGVCRATVAQATGLGINYVSMILEKFVSMSIVLHIDGLYLSLSTNMDHILHAGRYPSELLGEVAHCVQSHRMAAIWEPIKFYEARNSPVKNDYQAPAG